MAVYTHLGAEDLAELIAHYDVGALVSAKGIAEGVSNSNWLVDTENGRFILTMYERRIELADLPFFLGRSTSAGRAGSIRARSLPQRSNSACQSRGRKSLARASG